MSYRILIVEDNHSFIDSLKVMLKDYPFQFESVYRFRDAEKELQEKGAYLPHHIAEELIQYEQALNEFQGIKQGTKKKEKVEVDLPPATDSGAPQPPELPDQLFDQDGYLFVLIEQDAETSLKGLDFIRNMVKLLPQFHHQNFILMGNNVSKIESEATQLGIPVLQKPFRQQDIQEVISQKLAEFENLKARVENLFQLAHAVLSARSNIEADVLENENIKKNTTKKASKKAKKKATRKSTKKSSKKTSKKKATKSTKKKKDSESVSEDSDMS